MDQDYYCHCYSIVFVVVIFFFEAGLGNSRKKYSCIQKLLKEKHARGPWRKNRASVLYYPGPIFDVKQFLHRLLPTQKRISL